ncbi:FlgB family protein [Sulfitobacter aestuariivivens]|uniref:FlgB family protein n=1 Tax=Sulfitobacter aestuariivivens TaxID=2766981 RepID=A0A927D966_9RHOB|nr:FlgB family protein [Sulfitobacter aestuariivivens]MBD3665502.1 FlgB family protein [Sulfitobacter aestuariivivens]
MFDRLDVFKISIAMAKHAGQKQAIVAQNVANADTPGYVARTLPDFKTVYQPAGLVRSQIATRASHLNGAMPGHGHVRPIANKMQASPNGNQVSLEEEMLNSVAAKRQHDRAIAIYKSSLKILRSTIRS